MTRFRLLSASLLTVIGISACDGFKEAMTAHVDVVARAGSQELSVTRLAELLGNSEIPLRPDAARTVAQLWVNYQLLGHAAAQGDSLVGDATADDAMWSLIAQVKSRKFYEQVSASWKVNDTAGYQQRYQDGALLGAAHILLAAPREGLSTQARDSIRAEAEKIAATVTSATFADVAKKRSMDPGSKDRGGVYDPFPPGTMVPEFEAAIRGVPLGGITKVVETQFGYHIIRRSTWDEVKDKFAESYQQIALQSAETEFLTNLEKNGNVEVKATAAKVVKSIAEDPDAFRDDKTVIATSRSGNLDAARMAKWMAAFPPQTRMRAQVIQAPDSAVPDFVRGIMRNELVLRAADSAGVKLDSAEINEMRRSFAQGVMAVMASLKVSPSQLRDSAKTTAERERLAATRIDDYVDQLLTRKGEYIEVPEQAVLVLRAKYENRVVTAGVERALERANQIRAAMDSTRARQQPSSTVPMPAPTPAPGAGTPPANP